MKKQTVHIPYRVNINCNDPRSIGVSDIMKKKLTCLHQEATSTAMHSMDNPLQPNQNSPCQAISVDTIPKAG